MLHHDTPYRSGGLWKEHGETSSTIPGQYTEYTEQYAGRGNSAMRGAMTAFRSSGES